MFMFFHALALALGLFGGLGGGFTHVGGPGVAAPTMMQPPGDGGGSMPSGGLPGGGGQGGHGGV
jgi:hypothetical protein